MARQKLVAANEGRKLVGATYFRLRYGYGIPTFDVFVKKRYGTGTSKCGTGSTFELFSTVLVLEKNVRVRSYSVFVLWITVRQIRITVQYGTQHGPRRVRQQDLKVRYGYRTGSRRPAPHPPAPARDVAPWFSLLTFVKCPLVFTFGVPHCTVRVPKELKAYIPPMRRGG